LKYLDPSKIIKNKVVVCVGTRPSFVKMAPVIFKLAEVDADYKVLHTGQHYSPDLADIYNEVGLDEADHWISGLNELTTHGEQIARIMVEAEKYFIEEKPALVLVCGDANFNFACGVAARKLRLALGHVESGLRSGDMRTPEEHNRRMLDHISDYLFAPTFGTVLNLAREFVPGMIVQTGNTVVDSLNMVYSDVVRTEPPSNVKYALLTLHREENVDDVAVLKNIIKGLKKVKDALGIPILYPAHPRTIDRLKKFNLTKKMNQQVKILPPMPYVKFLAAIMNAQLVLTDSGGVQEEACTLQVPSVILRNATERPESILVRASMLAGTEPKNILKATKAMIDSPRDWINPFDPYGDQNAAERIVNALGLKQ